jgi:hypothetical protein
MDAAGSTEGTATNPLHYIVAVDELCKVRDVTERYAKQWLTSTRKLRTNPSWWGETVELYQGNTEVRGSDPKAPIDLDGDDDEAAALKARCSLEHTILHFEDCH